MDEMFLVKIIFVAFMTALQSLALEVKRLRHIAVYDIARKTPRVVYTISYSDMPILQVSLMGETTSVRRHRRKYRTPPGEFYGPEFHQEHRAISQAIAAWRNMM